MFTITRNSQKSDEKFLKGLYGYLAILPMRNFVKTTDIVLPKK